MNRLKTNDPKDKARRTFIKFLRKVEVHEKRHEELNLKQMNRDAVKSIFILPEVIKTDTGFTVL